MNATFEPDDAFDAYVKRWYGVLDNALFYRQLAKEHPRAGVSHVKASAKRQGLVKTKVRP